MEEAEAQKLEFEVASSRDFNVYQQHTEHLIGLHLQARTPKALGRLIPQHRAKIIAAWGNGWRQSPLGLTTPFALDADAHKFHIESKALVGLDIRKTHLARRT